MHAALTRAAGQRRGRRRGAAALAAFGLALTVTFAGPADAAQLPLVAGGEITGSLHPAGSHHELRIEATRPGAETLALGARLRPEGGLIARPIAWTVRHSLSGRAGDVVWQGEVPVADVPLPPGDYTVEATYGTARVYQPVNVAPGQRLAMTFILNVGGIRALSRIEGVGFPAGLAAAHSIYAVSGPDAGRRVGLPAEQGDVVRLVAGTYRIESRFVDGNTVAEAKVTVRPGMLSSIEISHVAAFARITVPAAEGDAVSWTIREAGGTWSRKGDGDSFGLVLAPGTYEVTARVGGRTLAASLTVGAGELKHVTLGE